MTGQKIYETAKALALATTPEQAAAEAAPGKKGLKRLVFRVM